MYPLSAGWLKPAFGATPPREYPYAVVVRALLLGAYVVLALAGALRFDPAQAAPLTVVIVAIFVLVEVILFRSRKGSQERAFRAWAVAFFLDIPLIMLAAFGHGSDSIIPALAVATVLVASTVFRPPYVAALAAFAIASELAQHLAVVAQEDEVFSPTRPVAFAVLLAGTAAFGALRGRDEALLRRRLAAAEAHERKQAESLRQALAVARVAEERFNAVSGHAPAVFLLCDETGTPTYASAYLTRLTGLTLDDIRDLCTLGPSLIPDEIPRLRETLASALGGQDAEVEFSLLLPDRSWRFAAVFFPVPGGAGAIMRDVTAERALALHLQRVEQMETVGTLAGGVAHDFNNLLTAVLGNLYLAQQELPAESPLQPLLADARLAAERGADLVRKLLAFSRPSSDQRQPIALDRLLAETGALARRGLTPQVELIVEPPPPGATVQGNLGELEQVLLNLIVNARDAMPAGGTITLSCVPVHLEAQGHHGLRSNGLEPGDYHALIVSDTGTGIAPDIIERIFEPFFTTKEPGKGTGLGLATSWNIVRAHGGRIEVQSIAGQGTTFRILLPALS